MKINILYIFKNGLNIAIHTPILFIVFLSLFLSNLFLTEFLGKYNFLHTLGLVLGVYILSLLFVLLTKIIQEEKIIYNKIFHFGNKFFMHFLGVFIFTLPIFSLPLLLTKIDIMSPFMCTLKLLIREIICGIIFLIVPSLMFIIVSNDIGIIEAIIKLLSLLKLYWKNFLFLLFLIICVSIILGFIKTSVGPFLEWSIFLVKYIGNNTNILWEISRAYIYWILIVTIGNFLCSIKNE